MAQNLKLNCNLFQFLTEHFNKVLACYAVLLVTPRFQQLIDCFLCAVTKTAVIEERCGYQLFALCDKQELFQRKHTIRLIIVLKAGAVKDLFRRCGRLCKAIKAAVLDYRCIVDIACIEIHIAADAVYPALRAVLPNAKAAAVIALRAIFGHPKRITVSHSRRYAGLERAAADVKPGKISRLFENVTKRLYRSIR